MNEIRSNIIAILRSGLGIGVELFDLLSIDQLENGKYRILDQRDTGKSVNDPGVIEFIHDDVKKAVDHFLKIREERKLGFDFEKANPIEELLNDINSIIDANDGENLHIHGSIPLETFMKVSMMNTYKLLNKITDTNQHKPLLDGEPVGGEMI